VTFTYLAITEYVVTPFVVEVHLFEYAYCFFVLLLYLYFFYICYAYIYSVIYPNFALATFNHLN